MKEDRNSNVKRQKISGPRILQNNTRDLREEIKLAQSEVIQKTICSNGRPKMISEPTPRAVLAKKGLLMKKTLGYGSYSKVKLCECLFRGPVAVKIMDKEKIPANILRRFLPRELKVWSQLKHQNIVHMHTYFEAFDRIYVVLEYAKNGDVLNYVQTYGSLDDNYARTWSYQIVNAISYLHNRDIAHRDLKLENLVIDDGFNLKLCDFGFVKANGLEQLTNTFCGSLSYAPPEILSVKPYLPKKADIWSLGVIVYILISGRMPFDQKGGFKGILAEQAKLDFNWGSMNRIPSMCKRFISSILKYKFRDRPTIDEVKRHPWFKGRMTEMRPPHIPIPSREYDVSTHDVENRRRPTRRQRPRDDYYSFPGYFGLDNTTATAIPHSVVASKVLTQLEGSRGIVEATRSDDSSDGSIG